MKVTFLVELELDDTDLIGVSNDIANILTGEFEVTSVKPWQRPTLNPPPPLPPV